MSFSSLTLQTKTNEDTEELSLQTGRILMYQKEFNEKSYRKTLLERAINGNKNISQFNKLENEYMKLSSNPVDGHDELLIDMKKQNLEMMKKEKNELETKLKNLDRTIGNLRLEVKSKTSTLIYNKWSLAIHESTKKMKEMFIKNNEDLYKVAMNREKTMDIVMKDIHRISKNMVSQYLEEEEEMDNLIQNVKENSPDVLNTPAVPNTRAVLNASSGLNDSGFFDESGKSENSKASKTFCNGEKERLMHEKSGNKRKKIKNETENIRTSNSQKQSDDIDEIGEVNMTAFEGHISKYLK